MTRVRAVVVAATDVGRRRSHNEDHHVVWVPSDPADLERRGILIMVADGMGGSLAGEVASKLAAETVVHRYGEGAGVDPLEDLKAAVEDANTAVFQQSLSDPSMTGMGTTCTALALKGREAWIAHVGDSRAYLCRGREIRQLTQDHSLVAHLVERNELSPEQARTDSRRNVVTRSVGVGEKVEVDAMRIGGLLEPGDTLLLCSDGLHGQVTDEEIGQAMQEGSMEEACQDLIGLANERGGPDNITVVMARIEAVGNPVAARDSTTVSGIRESENGGRVPSRSAPLTRRRKSRTWLLLLLALIALVLAVWSIVWLVGGMREESSKVEKVSAVTGSAVTAPGVRA